jgi:hypothetical protein
MSNALREWGMPAGTVTYRDVLGPGDGPTEDAGQTMEWLANHGFTGLLHRTVVVLNDSDRHADRRTRRFPT